MLAGACGGGGSGATPSPTALPSAPPSPSATATALPFATAPPSPTPTMLKEKISLQSGSLTLTAFVYKPRGNGPFPAIVWNHGQRRIAGRERSHLCHGGAVAEKDTDGTAAVFVNAGYVADRPGAARPGRVQGTYIQTDLAQVTIRPMAPSPRTSSSSIRWRDPRVDRPAHRPHLPAGPALRRPRAYCRGRVFLRRHRDDLRRSTKRRLQGGRGVIARRRELGRKRGSPEGHGGGRQAASTSPLPRSIRRSTSGLEPVQQVTGAEFQRLGKPYRLKIYPPTGKPGLDGHCFGGLLGTNIWAPDAIAFLNTALGVTP